MYKIKPVFFEKVWGGNKLARLRFDVSKDKKIGEAWVISGYPGSASEIELEVEEDDKDLSPTDEFNELFIDEFTPKNTIQNLRDFYKNNKEKFNNYPSEEFPLLAKILDANENLSVQVHPNDEYAKELEFHPFGKTECWYILDAEKNAKIQIGLNTYSPEEAARLINVSDWDKLLKYRKVIKGDVFNIKAGTVHAILKGTLVYELQQSSDITYRLYDYDRLDENGKQRELDIEKALKVIDFNSSANKAIPKVIKEDSGITIESLIKNEVFSLEKWTVDGKVKLSYKKNEKNFLLITLIHGSATINDTEIKKYESGIITADELKNISIKGNAIILVGNPN